MGLRLNPGVTLAESSALAQQAELLVAQVPEVQQAARGADALLLTFACSWLVMVLPAWLVTEHFDRQLRWLWLAASANIIVAGLLMVLRYRAGAWQTIRVIESGKKSVP